MKMNSIKTPSESNNKKNREKKSLCILTDEFICGGMERVVLNSLPALVEHYNVTLFVFSGIVEESIRESIPPKVRVRTGKFSWSKINGIRIKLPVTGAGIFRKEIRRHYDIMIVVKPLCRVAAMSHLADKHIYWNHVTSDVKYAEGRKFNVFHRINPMMLRFIYKHFDEVWQVNDAIRKKYEETYRLGNSYTIPNPVDINRIFRLSEEQPEDCSSSDEIFTIVMVGRLADEKGFDRVINAVGKIQPNAPYRIVIIGDGPEREQLQNLTTAYKLEKNIVFLGKKDNPYPYMREADLLICPSRLESFGLVIVEAMVLKIPVIATGTIGAEFVTQSGKYGVLVDNTDEAVEAALRELFPNMLLPTYSLEEACEWALGFDLKEVNKTIIKRIQAIE